MMANSASGGEQAAQRGEAAVFNAARRASRVQRGVTSTSAISARNSASTFFASFRPLASAALAQVVDQGAILS